MVMGGVLIAGCGVFDNEGKGDGGMNMQEAAEYSDTVLDKTLRAVKPAVQWAHDETTTGICDLSRRRTVMTVISDERRGNFLGLVERFWKKSGYEITSVNPNEESPAVFARTPEGFGISLIIGFKGQAFFEVATPCVDKSEVAAPTAKPDGPAYEGVEIPRPNVRSDFWSAAAPVSSPAPMAS